VIRSRVALAPIRPWFASRPGPPNVLRFCCGACRSRRRPAPSNKPRGGGGAHTPPAATAGETAASVLQVGMYLQILWLQTRMTSEPGEHARTDLFRIVKRKHEVRPARTLKSAMAAGLTLEPVWPWRRPRSSRRQKGNV